MILDTKSTFSDNQAITADAASTNYMDLKALGITAYNAAQLKHNRGIAEKIPLLIQVTEDFATCTSVTVQFQTDDNSSFSSAKNIIECTVLLAELKKGFIFPIDKLPRNVKERYCRLNYVVNGSDATAGKIFAGFVLAVDGAK